MEFTIISILLTVFSCASLPTPETGEEALLLIPLEWQLDRSLSDIGTYYVDIQTSPDSVFFLKRS